MKGRGKGLSLRKCQGRMRQHFKTGEGVKKNSLMLVFLLSFSLSPFHYFGFRGAIEQVNYTQVVVLKVIAQKI